MSRNILNQNFGSEDEEEEDDDFNPAPADLSDNDEAKVCVFFFCSS